MFEGDPPIKRFLKSAKLADMKLLSAGKGYHDGIFGPEKIERVVPDLEFLGRTPRLGEVPNMSILVKYQSGFTRLSGTRELLGYAMYLAVVEQFDKLLLGASLGGIGVGAATLMIPENATMWVGLRESDPSSQTYAAGLKARGGFLGGPEAAFVSALRSIPQGTFNPQSLERRKGYFTEANPRQIEAFTNILHGSLP